MKEKALYHLMQVRARKISNDLQGIQLAKVKEIQSTLKIERRSGTYVISWKNGDKDYSLTLEADPFRFYEKGDITRRDLLRTRELNYRALNWHAAGELWQRILQVSSLEDIKVIDDDRMSFILSEKATASECSIKDLSLALLITIPAGFMADIVESFLLFTIIILLILLANRYALVHLRKSISWADKLIISFGAILPLYFGVSLAGIVSTVAGLYLFQVAEMKTRYNNILFLLAGATLSIGMYMLGYFAVALAALLGIILVLVTCFDRQRISPVNVGFYVIGCISSGMIIYIAQVLSLISPYMPNAIGLEFPEMYTVLFLCILLVTFSVWWIVGVQYYLLPWFSMLALFFATVVVLFSDRGDVIMMLSVFSGFILFIGFRALAGIYFSMRKPDTIKV